MVQLYNTKKPIVSIFSLNTSNVMVQHNTSLRKLNANSSLNTSNVMVQRF